MLTLNPDRLNAPNSVTPSLQNTPSTTEQAQHYTQNDNYTPSSPLFGMPKGRRSHSPTRSPAKKGRGQKTKNPSPELGYPQTSQQRSIFTPSPTQRDILGRPVKSLVLDDYGNPLPSVRPPAPQETNYAATASEDGSSQAYSYGTGSHKRSCSPDDSINQPPPPPMPRVLPDPPTNPKAVPYFGYPRSATPMNYYRAKLLDNNGKEVSDLSKIDYGKLEPVYHNNFFKPAAFTEPPASSSGVAPRLHKGMRSPESQEEIIALYRAGKGESKGKKGDKLTTIYTSNSGQSSAIKKDVSYWIEVKEEEEEREIARLNRNARSLERRTTLVEKRDFLRRLRPDYEKIFKPDRNQASSTRNRDEVNALYKTLNSTEKENFNTQFSSVDLTSSGNRLMQQDSLFSEPSMTAPQSSSNPPPVPAIPTYFQQPSFTTSTTTMATQPQMASTYAASSSYTSYPGVVGNYQPSATNMSLMPTYNTSTMPSNPTQPPMRVTYAPTAPVSNPFTSQNLRYTSRNVLEGTQPTGGYNEPPPPYPGYPTEENVWPDYNQEDYSGERPTTPEPSQRHRRR